MTLDEFEKQVEKLVDDYITDEDRRELLKDFLIESCNAETIGDIYLDVDQPPW